MPLVYAGEYDITFELDKSQVQLGEEFSFEGEVFKDNEKISTGFVLINFKYEESIYSTPSFLSEEGFSGSAIFGVTPDGEKMLGGDYEVDITYNDFFGGEEDFQDVATLVVNDKLTVELTINEEEYNPGDRVVLSGTIEKRLGGAPEEGTVKITFGEQEYLEDLIDGKFEHTIDLADDIKSEYHSINIYVEDADGNAGEEEVKFYVVQIPTTLELTVAESSYLPEDVIVITPIIYDQAGDEVDDDVSLTVFNANKEAIYEKVVSAGNSVKFDLPKYSVHGTYKARAEYDKFLKEEQFLVKEVHGIDVGLDGQDLVIENIGNVPYNEPLDITVNYEGGSYSIEKRTKLNPGETFNVDLSKEVPSGAYDVNVRNTGDLFEEVSIEDSRSGGEKVGDLLQEFTGSTVGVPGSSTSLMKGLTLPLFIIIIVGLVIFITYRKAGVSEKRRERERKFARRRREEIVRTGKKKRFGFGKATDSDINDFKARVLKDLETARIKKEDKKFEVEPLEKDKKPFSFETPFKSKAAEKDEPKGLFSMFDKK